jgi:adenylate cyclase
MAIWSMSSDRPRRRLLAILAADAAGYSRLMALDDLGTVAALEESRVVFRSLVAHQGGRVVDTAGDSVLAVFESATAAAEAGLAAQAELGASLAHPSSPRKLLFRIGLHLGDVIEHTDGTIYGDGVNVASRLQALAEPGGIVISQSIFSEIRGRLKGIFVAMGPQSVKNIDEPIHAYRLLPADVAALKTGSDSAPARGARYFIALGEDVQGCSSPLWACLWSAFR